MSGPAAGDFNIVVKDRRTTILLFVVFYAATGFSALAPIAEAWSNKEYMLALVYSLYIVVLIAAARELIPRSVGRRGLEKNVFYGVGGVREDSFIPREEEVEMIIHSLVDNPTIPVFVVGASGAGKSVIVAKSVTKRMIQEYGFTVCRILEYDASEDSIKSSVYRCLESSGIEVNSNDLFVNAKLQQVSDSKKILLVFDQFEQFLELSKRSRAGSTGIREWFGLFVNNASHDADVRILIVVRKEWYYDLRFLCDHVPPPYKTCDISGLNIKKNDASLQMIKQSLNKVTSNSETTDYIVEMLTNDDEVLLMEYQIVGLVIENERAATGGLSIKEFQKEYGSMAKIIKKYFLLYLDISKSREISLKVLFAMSQQRRLKSLHRGDEIAAMVHERVEDVEECLKFFRGAGLIRKAPTRYELAHDYLADRYHEISGQELDPVERDNIVFFSEEYARGGDLQLTESKKTGLLAKIVGIYLALILIWRLLDPMVGGVLIKLGNSMSDPRKLVDFLFLPVFVAHALWSSYIVFLYSRLFVPTDRNKTDRVLSSCVLIACLGGVTIAVVMPPWWLVSISAAGLMVGLKFLSMSRQPSSGTVARSHFSSHGKMTIGNCLFVGFFGAALVALADEVGTQQDLLPYYIGSIFMFSLMMSYYRMVVTPQHITKKATSKMIGLLDRGRVIAKGGLKHAGAR